MDLINLFIYLTLQGNGQRLGTIVFFSVTRQNLLLYLSNTTCVSLM